MLQWLIYATLARAALVSGSFQSYTRSMSKCKLFLSFSFALVAQWIELPRPKGEMWVRFLLRAQMTGQTHIVFWPL